MATTLMSIIDAKEGFSELVNRVSQSKEWIILTRRDKELAAIVPFEDLLVLQAAKDQHDLLDATEALKKARTQGTTTLEDLKVNMD